MVDYISLIISILLALGALYSFLTSNTKKRIDDLEDDVEQLREQIVASNLTTSNLSGKIDSLTTSVARIEKGIEKLTDKIDQRNGT